MNTDEEKVMRTIEKARIPKNDDLVTETLKTLTKALFWIVSVFVLIVLPLLFVYILLGGFFVGYNKIFLDYLYPIYKFFGKEHLLIGLVISILVPLGYFLIILWKIIDEITFKKTVIYILAVGLYFTLNYISNDKMTDKKIFTNAKLESVIALQNYLVSRTITLDEMSKKFAEQISAAAIKLAQLRKKNNYAHYDETIADQKVINEIHAIQKAENYKRFAFEEQSLAYASKIKLEGIQKQLELDITALDELNDEQIAALIDQVDAVIGNIEPTANELVIKNDTETTPMKEIWEKYTQPNN